MFRQLLADVNCFFCNKQIDVLADSEHHIQQAQEIGAQLKIRKCRAAELDQTIMWLFHVISHIRHLEVPAKHTDTQ